MGRAGKILLALAFALIGTAAVCFYIGDQQHQDVEDWLGITRIWTGWHVAAIVLLFLCAAILVATVMLVRRER